MPREAANILVTENPWGKECIRKHRSYHLSSGACRVPSGLPGAGPAARETIIVFALGAQFRYVRLPCGACRAPGGLPGAAAARRQRHKAFNFSVTSFKCSIRCLHLPCGACRVPSGLPGTAAARRQRRPHRRLRRRHIRSTAAAVVGGAGRGQKPERANGDALRQHRLQDLSQLLPLRRTSNTDAHAAGLAVSAAPATAKALSVPAGTSFAAVAAQPEPAAEFGEAPLSTSDMSARQPGSPISACKLPLCAARPQNTAMLTPHTS